MVWETWLLERMKSGGDTTSRQTQAPLPSEVVVGADRMLAAAADEEAPAASARESVASDTPEVAAHREVAEVRQQLQREMHQLIDEGIDLRHDGGWNGLCEALIARLPKGRLPTSDEVKTAIAHVRQSARARPPS
jgi:3-mercaptopyruvate sulfurtransferase SseA